MKLAEFLNRGYWAQHAAPLQRQRGGTPTKAKRQHAYRAAKRAAWEGGPYKRNSDLLRCRLLAVSFRAVLLGRAYFHFTVHPWEPADEWPPRADDRQEIRMKTGALLARVASVAILLFAFGFAVFRASVQAISHDEALTYVWFLDGGVDKLLHFDANNHVLFTFLAKPFVKLLGPRELFLRAASLLGAAGYLAIAYLLGRKLFGDGLLFVIFTGLLALHPLVMDFASAARGYGLGLTFLLGAMYAFAGRIGRGRFDPAAADWREGCAAASVLLALAFAANLTNIIPALSLTLAFAIAVLPRGLLGSGTASSVLRGFVQWTIFPGAAAGLFLMWPFLMQARPYHFYVGYGRTTDTLRDVFNSTFLYRWTEDFFLNLGGQPPAPGSWQELASNAGTYLALPLVMVLLIAGALLRGKASAGSEEKQTALRRFFCGASAGCVILIAALHFTVHLKYPVSRTCLYVIPLFTVSYLLLAKEFSARVKFPGLNVAGILLAVLVLLDYASAMQAHSFRYNAYDVISRDLYQAIEKDALSRGLTNARVGGTWWYEPEINFYRLRYKGKWMLPYEINDRSYWWQTAGALEPAGYDYFVFVSASDPHLTGPSVRTIFHDEKTQATIIAIAHD